MNCVVFQEEHTMDIGHVSFSHFCACMCRFRMSTMSSCMYMCTVCERVWTRIRPQSSVNYNKCFAVLSSTHRILRWPPKWRINVLHNSSGDINADGLWLFVHVHCVHDCYWLCVYGGLTHTNERKKCLADTNDVTWTMAKLLFRIITIIIHLSPPNIRRRKAFPFVFIYFETCA